MRNRVIKLIFPVIAVLLLAPWPVAYAYSYEGNFTGSGAIQIEAAEPSAAPSARAFGRSVSSITPGDLFYIDSTDSPADFLAALHLTNADEMARSYRYLVLNVGTYVEDDAGEGAQVSSYGGQPAQETFLTLLNGSVSFSLRGYARYKIAVDGGNFYWATNVGGGVTSPRFYLTVD